MGEKKRRLASQMHTQGQAPGQYARPISPGSAGVSVGAMLVRPAFEADLEQITTIYHHHVMTGTGTFDLDPPDVASMRARWAKIAAAGWPFLVACTPQQFARVLGYAYAQPFRERKAYAKTFEDSIYVAPFCEGRGVGTYLIAALLEDCKAQDVREMIAVIGDADNAASIALHAKAGFDHVGRLYRVGHKFGRWLDVVLMQRSL